MKSTFIKKGVFALLAASAVAWSCSKDDKDQNADPNAALKQQIVDNYASMVYANYQDSYDKAVILKNKIDAFVANPTQSGFDDARQAWLDSREPYGLTEAYRFYAGPIDNDNDIEGQVNSWPLDESHIDYVQNGTGSEENNGNEADIINNPTDYPAIDEATLVSLNGNGGEKNISIGYHAIEFLLWGQDFNTNGPGDRPYTDYVTDGSGTHQNQGRRGEYLKLTAKLLVEDLKELVDAWEPGKANYRKSFVNDDLDISIAKMMTGMGVLSKSELAGERMYVALDNQDQEDEQSCFSDNTHRDIILDATSVQNVYFGTYTRPDGSKISGASLNDLMAKVDATVGQDLGDLINQSVADAKTIHVPFDQALTMEQAGGNGPIMTTVRSLQDQGDKIVEAADKLGITVTTEAP